MIDFTNSPTRHKTYRGANGGKISILYNSELYMLKFPAVAPLNKQMSYANGCVSEYLGCHIFESIGIPVQETLLGTYVKNGNQKIVVACKDFAVNGLEPQDFASLKNTIIDSSHNGYGTELSDIEKTLKEQASVDPKVLTEWFWDMFIVDALIGNWDRHNGNWGFLYNSVTDETFLSPIYDCGSCLYPQADESIMKKVLEDENEKNFRIFEIPTSGLKIDGKKINYFNFISSLQNSDCNEALKRIVPKINIAEINSIIDNTPYITDLQKEFYKTMLEARKEKILDFSLERLKEKELAQSQENDELTDLGEISLSPDIDKLKEECDKIMVSDERFVYDEIDQTKSKNAR